MKTSNVLVTEPSGDYELLDSGDGQKLERFGKFTLSRPDPQALWAKKLGEEVWDKSDGYFMRDESKGDWTLQKNMPERWEIALSGLKFYIKPTAFKHTGLFPEQSVNWEWLEEQVKNAKSSAGELATGENSPEVLNLFGYTGGATLACAKAGAKVVHVDGSKSAITWARENADLSDLANKPIRWILDDARTFVRREVKRGRLYDGIIMDPPAFGHGPEKELWKIEDDLVPLLNDCFALLKPNPTFFVINGYSAGYSAIAYENILLPLVAKFGGAIEIGELAIKESGADGRLLPAGIFARWSR